MLHLMGAKGVVLEAAPLEEVTEIVINGAAGVNDTLIVDFRNGLIGIPITWRGGDGGFDTLVIEGGSFTNSRYIAEGPDSGTIHMD
ncbi:MAG: hypothetical protein GWO24_11190, partial [Akkermansiaceae bacterium]|nr:hypothetical protein [Akkermansiaceae bacterium]